MTMPKKIVSVLGQEWDKPQCCEIKTLHSLKNSFLHLVVSGSNRAITAHSARAKLDLPVSQKQFGMSLAYFIKKTLRAICAADLG
jgi:hypothetical protein